MKIIFFTNKSTHGVELLKALHAKGIHLDAIFLETVKVSGYRKRIQRMRREVGLLETGRFLLKALVKRYVTNRQILEPDYYRQFATDIFTVDNFNGAACQQLMQQIEPDLLVLGGARILKNHIIEIPRIGVLNAHPGLLPHYRGVDVIPWAIYNDDPVGVTVHVVDIGVDTGAIILQHELKIETGNTLPEVRAKAEFLAGTLMAEAVAQIIERGKIDAETQPFTSDQYYKMPREILNQVEAKLAGKVKK